MDREREEKFVEVPFESILDRTEDEMYFDLGPKQVWISNEFLGRIDEMRGVIEVVAEFAKEEELL